MADSHHTRVGSNDKAQRVLAFLGKKREAGAERQETISKRPVYSPCPASFAQQRLWFVEQMSPGSANNLQTTLPVRAHLDVHALKAAWLEVVRRHEVLRTTLGLKDGQVMQFISTEVKASLSIEDLRDSSPSDRQTQLRDLLQKEGEHDFDLSKGPLARVLLIGLDEEEYSLCFTMHHIITDGWSLGVLIRELTALYEAFREGRPNPLAPLAIQYADFAWWQRQHLTGDVLDKQMSYWRSQLDNSPILELPLDHPRIQKGRLRGASLHFQIPAHLAERLRELGRKNQASLFMILLAGWKVFLYRYSSQPDVVVGAPIANRTRIEIESLIGFFVNTLVLRTDLSGDPSFTEVLARVRTTTLDAYEHQEVPYEKLVAELHPERTGSRSPFFATMLNWVNTPGLEFAGTRLEPISLENLNARFDLALHIMETNGTLPTSFEYDADLYEAATIAQMAEHFHNLLTAIATGADRPISKLNLLSQKEHKKIVCEWSLGALRLPSGETMLELLHVQAQKSPEHQAVICEGEAWSYRELHQRANQLAHFLKKLGAGPEVPVAICMERNLQLVAALLGVLKAGAAYVPLDPNYPAERLKYMLEDSGTKVLLTQEKLLPLLNFFPGKVVNLDRLWREISDESTENLATIIFPDNLAYVIYTSGSTGKPKGVAIRHSSAAVMLRWAHQVFSSHELSCVLASTSICFDISVFEIFAPLSYGGTVLMAKNALELAKVSEAGITLVNTVPSVMRELLRNGAIPGSVQTVNLAGESLSADLVRDVYANDKIQRVCNLYGPSEDTTYSTYAFIEREAEAIPIGRPIANTCAYVLDEWMYPAPAGLAGELYLGGAGLARGYLNRPEMTAERFLPDPFNRQPGERLYRTGDRVRWRRDGTLEFLGRTDQQVKIRGFRIEPGEIESVLEGHPGIRQAVVIVRGDKDAGKRIVAFVAPRQDPSPTTQELRHHVKSLLPAYMMPGSYVFVDQLPLNANGKIDRRSLALMPLPDTTQRDILPVTPAEKALCRIWAEVLKRETVGVEDDFFALGGHSFLAVNLVSQIAQQYGRRVTFHDIFQHPTPRELASLIGQRQKDAVASERVCMNKGSADRAPLYVVHPVGGNILCYSDLARSVHQKQPVYAVQALPQEESSDSTIEEIASSYLGLINKRDRQGRYALGGWSFGALVALEMAQQAVAAGDQPAMLYLFDPPAPHELQGNTWTNDELVTNFVLTLVADFNGGKLPDLEKLEIELDPEDRSLKAQLRKAIEFRLLPENSAIDAHARYFGIFKRNIHAAKIYQPHKYSGRTVLVLPEMRRSEIWEQWLPADTRIVRVAGNHFTMIRGSNAGEVAELIESGMDALLT
ncbi:MAG TPA: amino acid adenylation domain-containing protein [Candidatus Sulfotelmatobacter sp.]|nr:amino acid adenylation domain-containing protein [Candidatus Sulfotelmatobacter sp.]